MMHLQIGKAIHAILTADEAVKSAVGDKVFPISSKVDTTLPLVAYLREGTQTVYTKDGPRADAVRVSLFVVDETYSGAIAIAEAVRGALECRSGSFAGIWIHRITLADAFEDYDYSQDRYIQQLTFTIETYNS